MESKIENFQNYDLITFRFEICLSNERGACGDTVGLGIFH
jgi:hypothetical protein